MPTLFQIKTYFRYWLDQVSEHSLHSPFLFDLYTRVIHVREDHPDYAAIEQQRVRYLEDHTVLTVEDLGAGPKSMQTNMRRVRDIAATSVSPEKYSRLYARLIRLAGARTVLELGTSLGINTLYMATCPGISITTLEGSAAIAGQARRTFGQFAQLAPVQVLEGDIGTTLPAYTGRISSLDFAFLDANHRYAPTIKYFNLMLPRLHAKSIVVLDDIHYSEEMERAWEELRRHPLVYTSVDLYRCGILFFEPSLNKQHVVLQF
jgi:predicted O-methyltransferase YrrM